MIDLFEDNSIEYDTNTNGDIIALYKIRTHTGEDCSEWIDGKTMVDVLKETA